MHGGLFRTLAQNPEHVKTHCEDIKMPIHFACRK